MKSALLMVMAVIVATATAAGMPKPRVFVKNDGRWPATVLYSAATPNSVVWITNTGMIVDLRTTDAKGSSKSTQVRYDVIGSRGSYDVSTVSDANTPTVNILTKGHSDAVLKTADAVTVHDVLKGIDVEYVWDGDNVRYNIHADAGVTPPSQLFKVIGSTGTRTTTDGILSTTPLGNVSMTGVVSYQTQSSENLPTQYSAKNNSFGFTVQQRDMQRALTIDPIVRVIGVRGNADEGIYVVKRRADGTYIIGGWTTSTAFTGPADGIIPSTRGAGEDGFIAILNADLTTITNWTYISGAANERVRDIAIAANGQICAVGETNSADFPVKGSLVGQNRGNGTDGFIVVLPNNLATQSVGVLIAGDKNDVANGVAFNTYSQIVVVGTTSSESGLSSAPGYCDSLSGGSDGFLYMLNPTFQNTDCFSYLGGGGDDTFLKIALDVNNQAIVCGSTKSQDLYTMPRRTQVLVGYNDYGDPIYEESGRNAYNNAHNGGTSDVLVAKFTSTGDLTFATYFGGSGTDDPVDVFVDIEGSAFIAGNTTSTNLPIPGSSTHYNGNVDGFVASITADGLSLRGASYIGGTSNDYIYGITQFATSVAMLIGKTESTDFQSFGVGTVGPEGRVPNSFLARMSLTEITYATALGMAGDVTPSSITKDQFSDAIFCGRVTPIQGVPNVSGPADAFVSKWAFGTLTYRSPTASDPPLCATKTVQVRWTADGIDISQPNSVDFSTDNGATWTEVGTNIKARDFTYTVPASVPTTAQCRFRVRAQRGHEAATPSALMVLNVPNILTQPASAAPCPNASATLTVTVEGSNCTFQWRKNGYAIQGATTASYSIPSAQASDNGNYDVVVTNACLSVTSASADVYISDRPVFTEQPSSKTVSEGTTVVLSVKANGTDLTYKWQKGGYDLQHADADKPTLTLTDIAESDEGTYICIVNSLCGSSSSDAASVVVNPSTDVDGEEYAFIKTLLVHPQPAADAVMVSIPQITSNASLILHSMQGDELYRTSVTVADAMQTVTIDTSTLPIGTYTVQLVSRDGIYAAMVSVIR